MAGGIEVRHQRSCPTREGKRCRCRPRYRAWVYIPGEARKRSATFSSVGDARRWRTQTQNEVDRGLIRGPSTVTVRQAADELLELMDAGVVRTRSGDLYKPSVIRSYRGCLRRYVLDDLGGARLDQVRRGDVQALVERLLAGGLDASTVRNALMPLRVIYRRAVRAGVVATSPCDQLELPAVRSRRERVAAPTEALSLIAAVPADDRPIWATAFFTGLRRGELRALSPTDVDLDARLLRVTRQLDERNRVVSTKSNAGTRVIPIVDDLLPHLAARVARGGQYLLGVQNPTRPFSAARVQRRADEAWRAAGLDRILLHEARHTFASVLIAAGLDPKQVSVYVGHASVQTTFDVYGKLFPTSREEALRRIHAFLAATTSPDPSPRER